MNYLAHLYLADRTGTSLAGSLLGDVVRGPLEGRYSAELERGIHLHRRVDSFTDRHPLVLAAKARLQAPYRRYAGILLDVYFDHCLAQNWPHWHQQSLQNLAAEAYQKLLRESMTLAHPGFTLRLAYMRSRNLLLSYREPAGIERALQGLASRLSRANPLATGLDALLPIADELRADFQAFFPELVSFAEQTARDTHADSRHS